MNPSSNTALGSIPAPQTANQLLPRFGSHRSTSLACALSLLVALSVLLPTTLLAENRDPKAVEIAHRSMEAMGGEEAFEATRFLRFDFFGFRLHHWDRHTGLHRLEGKTREGESYVVISSLHERKGDMAVGHAWLDGQELEGDDLKEWLERAYGAWINDTYWLLMPTKLLDPGVSLAYDGEEVIDGRTYDKLELTFESVGLTPGDTYWAWMDRETGLMHRWAYFLQDWEEGREPTAWDWKDWQSYGSIKLSPTRHKLDDDSVRSLGKLAVLEHLDESVFTSPEPISVPDAGGER